MAHSPTTQLRHVQVRFVVVQVQGRTDATMHTFLKKKQNRVSFHIHWIPYTGGTLEEKRNCIQLPVVFVLSDRRSHSLTGELPMNALIKS